jgi:hypothetical protein
MHETARVLHVDVNITSIVVAASGDIGMQVAARFRNGKSLALWTEKNVQYFKPKVCQFYTLQGDTTWQPSG